MRSLLNGLLYLFFFSITINVFSQAILRQKDISGSTSAMIINWPITRKRKHTSKKLQPYPTARNLLTWVLLKKGGTNT
jgi:hypothetical protein